MKSPGAYATTLLFAAVVAFPLSARAQDDPRLRRPSEYRVDAAYQFYYFDNDLDPWHYVSAWVERRERNYSLLGRVNYAHRFNTSAVQFELDAYPLFSPKYYAYFNIGYSSSETSFPEWRLGGELYANLPGAWEASGGFRYLTFATAEVRMLSGSVGKYYGNYWTSLRPTAAFDDGEVSYSLLLITRRYFADADNFVGGLIVYGNAPDERISAVELDRLSNFQISISGKHPMGPALSWLWGLSFQREELRESRFRNRIGFAFGFESRI